MSEKGDAHYHIVPSLCAKYKSYFEHATPPVTVLKRLLDNPTRRGQTVRQT